MAVIAQSTCGLVSAARQIGERLGGRIARLSRQAAILDGPAVQARRRAGLQPTEREAQVRQPARQPERGRIAGAPRGPALAARGGSRRAGTCRWSAPPRPRATCGHRRPRRRRSVRPGPAPDPRPGSPRRASPACCSRSRPIALRYSVRSACARGPRTAGPLLRLRSRNWIPARSIARPIRPSRASISRTRWPRPRPPIAGLHDITPIVARWCVSSRVRAPMRALAAAASQPAWPPPMTTTSNLVMACFWGCAMPASTGPIARSGGRPSPKPTVPPGRRRKRPRQIAGRQPASALFHVKRDRRAQKRQWARSSTLWLS